MYLDFKRYVWLLSLAQDCQLAGVHDALWKHVLVVSGPHDRQPASVYGCVVWRIQLMRGTSVNRLASLQVNRTIRILQVLNALDRQLASVLKHW
jgi:hypothetical protein